MIEKIKQFIRYLFIGGSTAIFELSLYTILRSLVHLSVSLSNVTAVVVATILNFLLNRNLAFKGSSNFTRSLILYIILFSFNTTFSTYAIIFMVKLGIVDTLAKLATMGLITM